MPGGVCHQTRVGSSPIAAVQSCGQLGPPGWCGSSKGQKQLVPWNLQVEEYKRVEFYQAQIHSLKHTFHPYSAEFSVAYRTSPKTIFRGPSSPVTFVCVTPDCTPCTSPYLSVQLFNQGDVSKIGVNGKDTSSTGVKADVVGDRVSLWVCPIQGVHMRAWKETQTGDLELGTQLFLRGAVALNQGFNRSYSDCNSVPKVQHQTEHLLLSSPLLAASHSLSLFLTAVSEVFVWATLQLAIYDTD